MMIYTYWFGAFGYSRGLVHLGPITLGVIRPNGETMFIIACGDCRALPRLRYAKVNLP
jgi:hypothetical protein